MIESLNAALVECVKACGGSAMVGAKLWPEKEPMAAQRALLDCLNEDRPAKLSPEQVLFVLRCARSKGYHEAMEFFSASAGYAPPVPVDPRDALAEQQRQFIETTHVLAAMARRIEQLAEQSLRAPA